jgi:nitroimidazol reductase NimA-like FMN-containing flavoprotein (pyridoxamine 5'-phosphate oxidase superfamily)
MVRAAVTGAIDYSRADPKSRQWRIRHRLILNELERTDDQKVLEYTHQQWCSYLGHGSLKEESFNTAKKAALKAFRALERVVLPWAAKPETPEEEAENSTIDKETEDLIKMYKQKMAAREQAAAGKQNVQQ